MRRLFSLVAVAALLAACNERPMGETDYDGLVRVYPPHKGYQLRGYDISDSYAPNAYVELLDLHRKTRTRLVSYTGGGSITHGEFSATWDENGVDLTITLPEGVSMRNAVASTTGLNIRYRTGS